PFWVSSPLLIPRAQPHPVEVQSLGLALAVVHERIKGVQECPGIAHGGEWPGDIAECSVLRAIRPGAEGLPEQPQVGSPFLELLPGAVDRRIRQWLALLQGL